LSAPFLLTPPPYHADGKSHKTPFISSELDK
jgi:hypothetical protein